MQYDALESDRESDRVLYTHLRDALTIVSNYFCFYIYCSFKFKSLFILMTIYPSLLSFEEEQEGGHALDLSYSLITWPIKIDED